MATALVEGSEAIAESLSDFTPGDVPAGAVLQLGDANAVLDGCACLKPFLEVGFEGFECLLLPAKLDHFLELFLHDRSWEWCDRDNDCGLGLPDGMNYTLRSHVTPPCVIGLGACRC